MKLTLEKIIIIVLLFIVGILLLQNNDEQKENEELPTTTATTSIQSTSSPAEKAPIVETGKAQGTSATIQKKSPTISLTGKVAPALVRPDGYTNTDPIILSDYIGKKIVLLEFWTTSSAHALRTMPYMTMWDGKYRNFGLVTIGVHTPRFEFEKSKTTVDAVAQKNNMNFPIVIDNSYGTWNAYKNTLWPHRYLIDINGRIVHEFSGEGGYEETEKKIRELLNARSRALGLPYYPESKIETPKGTSSVDPTLVKSPESFFGSMRNSNLADGKLRTNGIQTFEYNKGILSLNTTYLGGHWNFSSEYASNMTADTSIRYRYNAKSVSALFGALKTIRVKVLLDGAPLSQTTAGKDIRFEKGESVFYVDQTKLYNIIENTDGYGEHVIEILPDQGGLNAYTLTFG